MAEFLNSMVEASADAKIMDGLSQDHIDVLNAISAEAEAYLQAMNPDHSTRAGRADAKADRAELEAFVDEWFERANAFRAEIKRAEDRVLAAQVNAVAPPVPAVPLPAPGPIPPAPAVPVAAPAVAAVAAPLPPVHAPVAGPLGLPAALSTEIHRLIQRTRDYARDLKQVAADEHMSTYLARLESLGGDCMRVFPYDPKLTWMTVSSCAATQAEAARLFSIFETRNLDFNECMDEFRLFYTIEEPEESRFVLSQRKKPDKMDMVAWITDFQNKAIAAGMDLESRDCRYLFSQSTPSKVKLDLVLNYRTLTFSQLTARAVQLDRSFRQNSISVVQQSSSSKKPFSVASSSSSDHRFCKRCNVAHKFGNQYHIKPSASPSASSPAVAEVKAASPASEVICFYCRKPGHKRPNCPDRKAGLASTPAVHALAAPEPLTPYLDMVSELIAEAEAVVRNDVVERKGDLDLQVAAVLESTKEVEKGNIPSNIVPIAINGHDAYACHDSGSFAVVFSYACADKFGLERREYPGAPIPVAGGVCQSPVFLTSAVISAINPITEKELSYTADQALIMDLGKNTPCLIGRPAWATFGWTIENLPIVFPSQVNNSAVVERSSRRDFSPKAVLAPAHAGDLKVSLPLVEESSVFHIRRPVNRWGNDNKCSAVLLLDDSEASGIDAKQEPPMPELPSPVVDVVVTSEGKVPVESAAELPPMAHESDHIALDDARNSSFSKEDRIPLYEVDLLLAGIEVECLRNQALNPAEGPSSHQAALIELKWAPNVVPRNQIQYRIPDQALPAVNDFVSEQLANNCIRKCNPGKWNIPLLAVPKKDPITGEKTSWRICLDVRALHQLST